MIGGGASSLEVRIDGNADGYDRALAGAQRATTAYEKSLESLNRDLLALEKQLNDEAEKRLQAQYDAYDKVGRGMVVAGGAMLVGAGLAGKAAMDWESAWAGVEKTVDGTPEQMAQLEKELRGLATTLPATHEEIAGVAEAAGQLGIAREDISSFTKTMIDLGETTNLSAEEAATGLARFMNIMGTAPDDVGRLGASLVDLGNKGASTEAEILAMSLRIAAAGNQAGMSESNVLAYANALSSLGVEAEAGGSAISTMFVNFQKGVETGGGAFLEYGAQVVGVSKKMFAEMWNSDAAGTFESFVSGLQRIDKEGGSVLEVLEAMGITQIRQRDALLRLVGGGDLLAKSLRDGSDAWREQVALVEEAGKRYQTTEARLQVAKNGLADAAITIGASLLPVLAQAADFTANLTRAFGMLPGPVKSLIGPLTVIAGLATLAGGAFMLAVPKIAAFNAALASGNLSTGLQRTGNAVRGIAGVLMGPWGVALTLGVAALGIFAAKQGEAKAEIDAVAQTLDSQTGAITENTQAWAAKKLADDGAIDAARRLGVDLGLVGAAATGQAPAMAELNRQLEEYQLKASGRGFGGSSEMRDNADAAETLGDSVGEASERVKEGQELWKGMKATTEGAAGAAEQGGKAQKKLAAELSKTSGEMKDQRTAAEQLVDALNKVNNAILGSRAGARDYQQTLADSRKELQKGVRTLNIHTKEGRDNQAALDNIAGSTLRWADSLKDVDKSGRRSFEVMRQGRKDLYAAARGFGMGEAEARRLVDAVLKIPKKWETKFGTPGSDKAQGEAKGTESAVKKIPKKWDTKVEVATQAARSAVQSAVSFINGALNNIDDEEVLVHVRRVGDPPGPGLQAKAYGGPITGGVRGRDSVGVLAMPGEHMWTAREVELAGGHQAMYEMRRRALTGELGRTRVSAVPVAVGGGGGRGGPMVLSGVLTIPGFGDGYVRGIVREELSDESEFSSTLRGRNS